MSELPDDAEQARHAGQMLGEWMRHAEGYFAAFGEGLHRGTSVEDQLKAKARRGWLLYLALLLCNIALISIGFLAGYLVGVGKL